VSKPVCSPHELNGARLADCSDHTACLSASRWLVIVLRFEAGVDEGDVQVGEVVLLLGRMQL